MDLPEGSTDDYIAAKCGDEGFDCDLLRAVADANRKWGAQSGLGHAETIERVAGADPHRARRRADRAAQDRADGERHAAGVGRPVKGRAALRSQRRAPRQPGRGAPATFRTAPALARDIAAGLRAGQAFAAAYTRAKRSAGVADFNDLIDWTRQLLAQPGMGDWVRYKLDRRVDHVLVDEAQDTNAAQWEIIERLVDEYFSGSSEAEERHRTLFMVGDFKQAIYGFQGTDPKRFDEARRGSGSARPRSATATICSATSGARASSATCRSRRASARRSRCSMSSMR